MITINVNNVGLDNPYDADDNGEISKDEAITAVDDYFLDVIDQGRCQRRPRPLLRVGQAPKGWNADRAEESKE